MIVTKRQKDNAIRFLITFSSLVVADNMSNRKQAFVNLVKHYPVLLSRSHMPHIKRQKAVALSLLAEEFKEQLGIKFKPLNLQNRGEYYN